MAIDMRSMTNIRERWRKEERGAKRFQDKRTFINQDPRTPSMSGKNDAQWIRSNPSWSWIGKCRACYRVSERYPVSTRNFAEISS
jgi:hypothetical protein